ncbi:nitroreductase [Comamonas humi]
MHSLAMPPMTDADSLALQRHSTRAFLDRPVADALVDAVVQEARWAPSGANLQPGSFWHIDGAARARLSEGLVQAFRGGAQEREDYDYFPRPLPMSLRKRQVAAAQALYGALGVARGDGVGRAEQFERNFRFFDAPAAMLITIDSGFGSGGYMDLGMAIYGLMLAAEARGLATCAIGAMASYPRVIREALGLEERHTVVCGMALGYADEAAPINRTRTERAALAEYFQRIRD